MTNEKKTTAEQLLLGQPTDYPKQYQPDILFAIARGEGRRALGLSEPLPFTGLDVWTHYEVSWLERGGKPRIAVAEIRVPADSPYLIESKSLKLYFNSLNFERFASADAFISRVETDLSRAAAAAVTVQLIDAQQAQRLAVQELPGQCLDDLPLSCSEFVLNADHLRTLPGPVIEACWHSHLLRSLCPVTQQPDWGSVLIRYRGPAMDVAGLLAYLVSYRDHADFHEQCVERIFRDIWSRCQPEQLSVYARYTRRGGLDINPFRSSTAQLAENLRLFRQ